jgi:hypothetical protein
MHEDPPPIPGQPARRGSRYIVPWLVVASPLLVLPLAEYFTVGPTGTWLLVMLPGLIVLPALVVFVFVFVGPFLLLSPRLRLKALRRWGLCLIFVASTIAGGRMAREIRNDAFHRLTQRSSDLVAAIKHYERVKGAPPPGLDALVPEFLKAVPGTGMAAYPAYRYRTGDDARRFAQNPWVLWVSTPSGGVNFDEFMYFPLQNYPQRGYGGSLQRIGDWAYLHE